MKSSSDTDSRSALVVRGGWESHQPIAATNAFIPFLEGAGFAVRVEDSPGVYADGDAMAAVDLIVQCVTMSTIAPDELAGLAAAVRGGTGFAGWHGGIVDSYRDSADYLHLVGGQFVAHPGKPGADRRGDDTDSFVPHRVVITEAGAQHPIMADLNDFDLDTEQYWVLTDRYNTVLATTTHPSRPGDPWHEPVACPAVWTREWGLGRVFVATPGHSVDVLAEPAVRTIIERGMLWASH